MQSYYYHLDLFTEIFVKDHDVCDDDLIEEIEILVKTLFSFSVTVISMMKFLQSWKKCFG